jgi:hypothetical protein
VDTADEADELIEAATFARGRLQIMPGFSRPMDVCAAMEYSQAKLIEAHEVLQLERQEQARPQE